MEVSESPCDEKTLKMLCKIFFLTNVCVTFQVQNEHQHIREGLSFEELHHHSPLDVEVAMPASRQSSRTAVTVQ